MLHVRGPNFHRYSCQNHALNSHLAKGLSHVTRISFASVMYNF
jgi:hypothetical protein